MRGLVRGAIYPGRGHGNTAWLGLLGVVLGWALTWWLAWVCGGVPCVSLPATVSPNPVCVLLHANDDDAGAPRASPMKTVCGAMMLAGARGHVWGTRTSQAGRRATWCSTCEGTTILDRLHYVSTTWVTVFNQRRNGMRCDVIWGMIWDGAVVCVMAAI